MPPIFSFHHDRRHRQRQLKWVLPLVGILGVGTILTLAVQYWLSDQAVGDEFFRAHKTITHTGEMLARSYLIGGVVLLGLLGGVGVWVLRWTHRIVRPVHTLHRALDALVAGNLGVRVELHPGDEFHEVGDALNRLAEEFSGTLARARALVERIERTAGGLADQQLVADARELDATIQFFRLEPRQVVREDEA